MSAHIQFISKEQTWDLRSRVLRPGLPLEQSHFPGDLTPQAFHVGAQTEDGLVVSVGTFHEEIFSDFSDKKSYRLRGMATDPEHRGRGYGKRIILFAKVELAKRHCDIIWFNARENAFSFYEKLGFLYSGELFDIPGVGPHKVMYKHLVKS